MCDIKLCGILYGSDHAITGLITMGRHGIFFDYIEYFSSNAGSINYGTLYKDSQTIFGVLSFRECSPLGYEQGGCRAYFFIGSRSSIRVLGDLAYNALSRIISYNANGRLINSLVIVG